MTVYSYIRVSTEKQNNRHWKTMVNEYVERKGLSNPIFLEDEKSGAIDWQERKLHHFLEKAKADDVLIVGEVSRLGRDAENGLNFLKKALRKGVKIHIIQTGMILGNDEIADMTNLMIVGQLFLFSEFERKLISMRTKLGLKEAKRQGKKLGGFTEDNQRKGGRKKHPKKATCLRAIRAGASINATAQKYNVSRPSIYRWLNE